MDSVILRSSPSSNTSSLPSYSSHRNGNGNSIRYNSLRNGKLKEDSEDTLWDAEEQIALEEIGKATGMLTPGGRTVSRTDSSQSIERGFSNGNSSLNGTGYAKILGRLEEVR